MNLTLRVLVIGTVTLAACSSDDVASPRQEATLEPPHAASAASAEANVLTECQDADDVAMCVVLRLDGPTEEEPLLALINAHEELGNADRAQLLRARYVALFDDETSRLFARQIIPGSNEPSTPEEPNDEPGDERTEREPTEDEGATDAAEIADPIEPEPEETDVAEANPLMSCAAESNYSACIIRLLQHPSDPREYEALVHAYRETGQRGRACNLMRQVIEQYPGSPASRRFRGYVQSQCN